MRIARTGTLFLIALVTNGCAMVGTRRTSGGYETHNWVTAPTGMADGGRVAQGVDPQPRPAPVGGAVAVAELGEPAPADEVVRGIRATFGRGRRIVAISGGERFKRPDRRARGPTTRPAPPPATPYWPGGAEHAAQARQAYWDAVNAARRAEAGQLVLLAASSHARRRPDGLPIVLDFLILPGLVLPLARVEAQARAAAWVIDVRTGRPVTVINDETTRLWAVPSAFTRRTEEALVKAVAFDLQADLARQIVVRADTHGSPRKSAAGSAGGHVRTGGAPNGSLRTILHWSHECPAGSGRRGNRASTGGAPVPPRSGTSCEVARSRARI